MKRPASPVLAVGDTVKVVRMPRHDWKIEGGYLGAIGRVIEISDRADEGPWVLINFHPTTAISFGNYRCRPWWLEPGTLTWTPRNNDTTVVTVPDDCP